MRGVTRTLSLVAAAGAVAAGAAAQGRAGARAAVSSGGVSISARTSTGALFSGGRQNFSVFVTLANTGPATDVRLSLGRSSWPGRQVFGGPLSFGTPTVTPPAMLLGFPPPSVPPLPVGACVRGAAYSFASFEVSIPAQTTATLTVPAKAFVPVWAGTDYTPEVWWEQPTGPTSWSQVPVPVPHMTMEGPPGVHITLATHPGARTTAHPGESFTVSGATDPAVRRRTVLLSVRQWMSTGSISHRLARLVTDRWGRFTFTGWRPRVVGVYQLLARIGSPGRGIEPDTGCAGPIELLPPGS